MTTTNSGQAPFAAAPETSAMPDPHLGSEGSDGNPDRSRIDIAAAASAVRAGATDRLLHPQEQRRAALRALRSMLGDRESDFTAALAADLGKSPNEAYLTEIGFTINEIDHALGQLTRWMRPTSTRLPLRLSPGRAWVRHEPLGAVLIIAPWNYPLQLALSPLVAAIAAGNTAVVAPSEIASATSDALARWIPEYLDGAVAQVVTGNGSVKQALIAERFDHIFYTGNGNVGRSVMRAAAEHLTPVTLELGGKSPVIVDATADLAVAARRVVWGKFTNAGQTCVAPDYVLVVDAAADDFIDAVTAEVRAQWGDDPQRSDDYGRIVNDHHFERLARLLDGCGGTIVAGGEGARDASYFPPTIVAEPALESALMTEEIFGPILPIVRVDDADAAVAFVNARAHPLALYVFSNDQRTTESILDRTSSGGVAINHTLFHLAVPELPFGGVGPSGMGSYHGRAGFDTFTHRRSVLRRSTRPDPSIAYPPYSRTAKALLRRLF